MTLVTLTIGEIRRSMGDAIPEDLGQSLTTIDHSARKLLRLVDGLLLLASRQEDKLRFDPAPCDLSRLVGDLVAAWKPAASIAGLDLSVHAPATLVATVDEAAIERVVANLVSNAIKFTPKGGRIDVELARETDGARISVRDTGIGLDREFQARMFGRFEQGRAAVRPGARGERDRSRSRQGAHGGTWRARGGGVAAGRGGRSSSSISRGNRPTRANRLAQPKRCRLAGGTSVGPRRSS